MIAFQIYIKAINSEIDQFIFFGNFEKDASHFIFIDPLCFPFVNDIEGQSKTLMDFLKNMWWIVIIKQLLMKLKASHCCYIVVQWATIHKNSWYFYLSFSKSFWEKASLKSHARVSTNFPSPPLGFTYVPWFWFFLQWMKNVNMLYTWYIKYYFNFK